MNKDIEKFMRYFLPNISQNSIELFSSIMTLEHYPKGKLLIKQGQIASNFYVIKSGIARSYMKDNDGKEHIRTLYTQQSTFGALSSLIEKKPSNASYNCLSECELYVANFEHFLHLTRVKHELAIFYNKVLEQIFIRTERKVDDLSLLSATERYLKVKKQIPNIDNMIPQYHIASYLNITPVQLSRIRKKLYSV